MDDERVRLEDEMATLRHEMQQIREQMVERHTVNEFIAAATDMLRRVDRYYRELFERRAGMRPDPSSDMEPDGPSRQIGKLSHPDWASYSGFREHLQKLEAETGLKPEHVSRELIAGLAGVHPKTLKRHVDTWGLDGIWPPSRFPVNPPKQRQLRLLGEQLAAVASYATLAILDGVSDGRIDSVIRICKMLFGRQHLNL